MRNEICKSGKIMCSIQSTWNGITLELTYILENCNTPKCLCHFMLFPIDCGNSFLITWSCKWNRF